MDWSFTVFDCEEILADVETFYEDDREDVDGAKEKPEIRKKRGIRIPPWKRKWRNEKMRFYREPQK